MLARLLNHLSFMSTSWYLWQQLHATIDHPIFKRTQRQYQHLYNAMNVVYVMFIAGIVALISTVFLFTMIGSAIIALLPLILVVFSSSYVVLWIYRVTVIIGIERENRTLDNVSITPVGQVCVKWMICIATVHHRDSLSWIDLSRQVAIGIISVFFAMALCLTITQISYLEIADLILFVANMLVLGAVIYVEHAQSILMACLVAMWIANNVPTRIDATVGAILIYLILQILTFIAGLSLAVFLQSGGNLDIGRVFEAEFFTLSFVMFALVREITIFILWRIIAYQSNASPNVLLMFAS